MSFLSSLLPPLHYARCTVDFDHSYNSVREACESNAPAGIDVKLLLLRCLPIASHNQEYALKKRPAQSTLGTEQSCTPELSLRLALAPTRVAPILTAFLKRSATRRFPRKSMQCRCHLTTCAHIFTSSQEWLVLETELGGSSLLPRQAPPLLQQSSFMSKGHFKVTYKYSKEVSQVKTPKGSEVMELLSSSLSVCTPRNRGRKQGIRIKPAPSFFVIIYRSARVLQWWRRKTE